MTLPQIIVDLMKLLFDLAVPSAICTMGLAGIASRQEGGLSFQAGSHFQKWINHGSRPRRKNETTW